MGKTQFWYHAGCLDGFTAAWAARKAMIENQTSAQAIFLPVQYGQELPRYDSDDKIYMLDFSCDINKADEIYRTAKSFMVLDHHETAAKELRGQPYLHFDNSRSGAMIAWEYFHPNTPAPLLVKLIQDRDLWKFEYKDLTKFLTAFLQAQNKTWSLWDDINHDLTYNTNRTHFLPKGQALVEHADYIAQLAAEACLLTEFEGLTVGAVNSTVYISEVCHRILDLWEVDIAAVYRINKLQQISWSLRSKGSVNVADIAKKFGGGGHKNAAGMLTGRIEDFLVSGAVRYQ